MSSSVNMSTATSGSGIDVDAIVSAMIDAERAPERIWQSQQYLLQAQAAALNDIQSRLKNLDSAVSDIRDVLGVFSENLATSSEESLLSASADSTAVAAAHTIKVTSLATNASYYSNALASSSTVIVSGSFTITAGATTNTIAIDSTNNTLDKLATYINGLGFDARATVVTDANGARLAINGTKTGKANDVQLSAVTGFSFTTASSADNAKLSVDGIPLESATNAVSGAIAGVTLHLTNASPSTAVTLTVAPDQDRVTRAVQNLVSNFNSLITAVNSQFKYDATNKTAGALSGDSTIRTLQEQLLGSVGYSSSKTDSIASLASIGVTMNDDGTLTFDSNKFSGLIQSNYSGVKTFFQGSGDGSSGFANSIGKLMDQLTDSTAGAIVIDLKGNSDAQKSITDQIDDFEVRIADRRQQLLEQYSKVDAILRQFPLTQNQVTAQLNSLSNLK